MVIIIEDIGLMDNNTEKELYNTKTREVMRVVGKMEKKMVMEFMYGAMESNIVAPGKMTRLMEEENLSISASKHIV